MTAPVPVGGTTGLDHESSAVIDEAARWLAEHRRDLTRAIVPTLREQFGLTTLEAVEAAALAGRYEFERRLG